MIRAAGPTMRAALLILTSLLAALTAARAETVVHESDIKGIRLGQHILVDDATCPTGQIKEVVGKTLTASGVMVIKHCIPRRGARTN